MDATSTSTPPPAEKLEELAAFLEQEFPGKFPEIVRGWRRQAAELAAAATPVG